jgi:hypothetical protein
MLTKDEREGYLSDYPGPFDRDETYVIRVQRNSGNRSW